MKKLLLILLLSSLFVGEVWATDYTQDANCVAAYLFLEGSGTTVADSSPNTNTGNFLDTGQPAWAAMSGTGAPTYSDYMVDGDNSDDYINIGNDSSLDITGAITLMGWYYCDSDDGNDDTIIGKDDVGSNRCYLLGYSTYDTEDGAQFLINNGSTLNYAVTSGSPSAITNWRHLCGVFSPSTYFDVYVDGVRYVNTTSGVATGILSSSINTYLINRVSNNPPNGKLGECAIFNVAETSTQINDIMDNGLVGSAPPVARRIMFIN